MPSNDNRANSEKAAACLNCRRSKVKCRKSSSHGKCERCVASRSECIIPAFHIGRQKGVKNKRTGLAKAIHQIEHAIKQSKGDSTDLKRLLELASGSKIPLAESRRRRSDEALGAHPGDQLNENDQFQYDDIENPLQLLARASDLQRSPTAASVARNPLPRVAQLPNAAGRGADINNFFLPLRAKLDVDDAAKSTQFDPIDMGLVTIEEAQTLIAFFHENLAHTRWGLDPNVHDFEFLRRQSAFLLTSMLAASALFIPSSEALARRLQVHRDWLAEQVISRRLRSVEIILAFMVNIPWMHPGQHAADDDTGLYISYALSIALDLSLNKIITPSLFLSPELARRISIADCIDATKALAMDGFEDVPVDSAWVMAQMLSMTILRRDLDDLFEAVRTQCDNYRVIDIGSQVAQQIESTIDHFYNKWRANWTRMIGDGQENSLPAYVEILVTHTRLSTYGGVINHPTAPIEVKRLFRASALSSALNVMRAAIQGESKLSSMPNNTVIMICFAACVAVQSSSAPPGAISQLAPSIFNLVDETAAVLERIGNVTPHRNGSSSIYGQHLKDLLQQASNRTQAGMTSMEPVVAHEFSNVDPSIFGQAPMKHQQYTMPSDWMGPIHFSSMSNDQVLESVLNAAPDFNAMLTDDTATNPDYTWMNFMNPPDFRL